MGRILHVLSPVKWSGDVYNSQADANWKVVEKTIRFLPRYHHYLLVPSRHDIRIDSSNVSYIRYDYPHSVQLNRGMFDYRRIRFDFTRMDVDYVFLHQPELAYNIQQWFHTNRYYEDVKYFGFYHWIDCNSSRGSVSGCPSFYMRQLESMHVLDVNFVHTPLSIDYLMGNFDIDLRKLIGKVSYMPLTSHVDVEGTPFDLPNKKILLFNHRWASSSGVDKFKAYLDILPDDYVVWVTDEACDLSQDNVIVKHLRYSDYCYLLQKCYASLCFIDGYTTWNLSAQDSIVKGRPLLYYKHPLIEKVVGIKGQFSSKEQFIELLNNPPTVNDDFARHDETFKENLLAEMTFEDTLRPPKDAQAWMDNINKGVVQKKHIAERVNPRVRLNGTAHYIRRHLLNNGYKDNINNPYTEYYREGCEDMIVKDLFSDI